MLALWLTLAAQADRRRLSNELLANYQPVTAVIDNAAIDIDLAAMESALAKPLPTPAQSAIDIYQHGGNAGSYAQFTVPALVNKIPKDSVVKGTSTTSTAVRGTVLEEAAAGATTLKVLYDTYADQVAGGGASLCNAGGLTTTRTTGCFDSTAELEVIAKGISTKITPTASVNKNIITLASFSVRPASNGFPNRLSPCCPPCLATLGTKRVCMHVHGHGHGLGLALWAGRELHTPASVCPRSLRSMRRPT